MSSFMSSIFDLFLGKLIILTEILSYMDLENGDIMRTVDLQRSFEGLCNCTCRILLSHNLHMLLLCPICTRITSL